MEFGEDFEFNFNLSAIVDEAGFGGDAADLGAAELDAVIFVDAGGVGEGDGDGVSGFELVVEAAELDDEGGEDEEAEEDEESYEEFSAFVLAIHGFASESSKCAPLRARRGF